MEVCSLNLEERREGTDLGFLGNGIESCGLACVRGPSEGTQLWSRHVYSLKEREQVREAEEEEEAHILLPLGKVERISE